MPQLAEKDRLKLDSIVQQMVDNGESEADIQFVVDDFKSKYGTTAPKPKPQITGTSFGDQNRPLDPFGKGVSVGPKQEPTDKGFLSSLAQKLRTTPKAAATVPPKQIPPIAKAALGMRDAPPITFEQAEALNRRTGNLTPAQKVMANRKVATPMELADLANEMTAGLTKGIAPAIRATTGPMGWFNPSGPEVAAGFVAGTATLPAHVFADAAVFTDPKSTAEQVARAGGNLAAALIPIPGVGPALRVGGKLTKGVITKVAGLLKKSPGETQAILKRLQGQDIPVPGQKPGWATEQLSQKQPLSETGKPPVSGNETGAAKGSTATPKTPEPAVTGVERYYHTTTPEVATSIRRSGFRASQDGELGPGVYLSQNEPAYPVHLRGKETATVEASLSDVRLLDIKDTDPNVPLSIYRKLYGDDQYSDLYAAANERGEIFSGGQPNWPALHSLLKEHGYGGIRRVGTKEGDRVTAIVVFDSKNATPKTSEPTAGPSTKEPWEMTTDEWATTDTVGKLMREKNNAIGADLTDHVTSSHQGLVLEAYNRGEDVPLRVLRDQFSANGTPLYPHAFTLDEYLKHRWDYDRHFVDRVGFESRVGDYEAIHGQAVESALKEGKLVPDEVVDEFLANGGKLPESGIHPDLASKYRQSVPSQPQRTADVTKPEPEIPQKGPKVENGGGKPEPNATGLANQVQSRKAIEGVLDEIEPTKGKNADEWQQVGKKAVDDGNYDPDVLAQRVARGDEELTGEKVGVLLEGARRHENAVNQAAKDLDDAIAKGKGVQEARTAFEDAKAAYQTFAENVQQGKGRWSDVGRALQAGTELDTGNAAQVIQAARRTGRSSAKAEAQLQKQAEQIADLETKLSERELELAKLKAEGVAEKTKRGPRFSRESLDAELEDLLKQGRRKLGQATAGLDPELIAIAGKIALNYAKRGVNTLDEIVANVQEVWRAQFGQEIDAQDVIDGMGAKQTVSRTKPEIEKELTRLRAQAKRESTAGKATIQGQIDELKTQLETGQFRTPTKREMQVSKEVEDLRSQKALYSGRVQAALRNMAIPMGQKAVREIAGGIRGTILGSDIGVLTRQGLFSLSRPAAFAKGVLKGAKAAFSEKALARIEMDLLSHDVAGQTAGVLYKKANLNLSNHLTNPEEMVVGRLLRRIPGIKQLGGSLERFQTAFINTVRSETFDRAVKAGFKDNELAARANFINSATGRSNMKSVPAYLEVIMTSPRYERSRWEMLAQPLRNVAILGKDALTGKGLNRGALANLQDMAVTAAEVYGLYKLAEASGYEVDFNPTSADFLKMRRGDEVWDPSAGIAPRMRDVMRLVAAYADPSFRDNWGRTLTGMATRTISPAIKQPAELGSQMVQRNAGVDEKKIASVFTGWSLDEDEKGWITLAPLVMQTAWKFLQEGDVPGAASAAGREFVGQSVNRYPKPKQSQ